MKIKDKVQVNPSLRQKSSTKVNNASFGIDIIGKEIKEELSNDSGISIDQHQSLSLKSQSFSPYSDKVIINSNDQNSRISRKRERYKRNRQKRRQQRKQFIYEKDLINKQQLSVLFCQQQNLLLKQDEKNVTHLFDEYSNENILKEWKPLTIEQSNELYQYALDKYHHRNN
ncbi:unnamed protein product [Rotaria sp. Silwood1]|nr:unnamed protein product [Rotaria sp. Silwood1]CAF1646282.1 unnamed protein product [Rotaria sp. Silwood1]